MTENNNQVQPGAFLRRSFHYRDLVNAGAQFAELGDAAIASNYGAPDEERAAAKRLGLADLSPLPRTGFKGWGTADWLSAQGVELQEAANTAYPCGTGSLAARLSSGDILILGSLDGKDKLSANLDEAWRPEGAACWPVPRRDGMFWFMLTGEYAPAMFAKICAVDLRSEAFPNHKIAQTSIARINGVIIRDDVAETPAFHVLGDCASASFLWSCLLDAMEEFEGRVIGLDAIQK